MTGIPIPSASATHLSGRDADLGVLRSFLDRSAVDGGTLLLTGEPGIGKTALLDEAAAMATASGSTVLRSAGVPFEADVGFAVLHQLLFPWEPRFGDLAASHQTALRVALGLQDGSPPERLVLAGAVLALLHRVAAADPVVVIVDDLPWVDHPTATVLAFVARRVVGNRIALLGAARTGGTGPLHDSGLAEHELAPLTNAAAADLIGQRFPSAPPGFRTRVMAEAAGNPLALLELSAALSDPKRAARATLPPVVPLPRRLEELFGSQIAGLPASTRRLVLHAALDSSGSLDVLRAGAEPDDEGALAAAQDAGLIRIDRASGTVAFRHPLIRTAVVDRATSEERREAHRALARTLIDEPDRQSWHLAESSDGPDEDVAAAVTLSAHRTLRRGDAQGAVTRLLRAAELSPHPHERAARLAAAAAIGASITGDLNGVTALLDDLRRSGQDLAWSLPAAVAATYVLLNGDGDAETAHRLLVRAIEMTPEPYDPADDALVEALSDLLLVCWFGGHRQWWTPFSAAIERFSPRPPQELYLLSHTFPDPARSEPAVLAELDRAISDVWDQGDPYRIMMTSAAAYFVDRLGRCREPLRRVLRDARQGGAVGLAMGALDHLCRDDILSGRWDEAEELADECRQLSDAHGYTQQTCTAAHLQAWLAALRGDRAADEIMAGSVHWATARGLDQPRLAASHVAVIAAMGRRDFEAAYRHAVAISPAGRIPPYVPLALSVALDLVDSAVRTGRRTEALAHVRAMSDAKLDAISTRLALVTAGATAMVADDDEADALFERALTLPDALRWPFELASIELAYGQRLRRTRAVEGARRHLSAAYEIFRRLGAKPWADHAMTELRAAGFSVADTAHRDPGSLTSQELEIAELAATGLTNKEIGARLYLSHRTVAAHLYAIFPKLGIASRAALRDALSPRGDRGGSLESDA